MAGWWIAGHRRLPGGSRVGCRLAAGIKAVGQATEDHRRALHFSALRPYRLRLAIDLGRRFRERGALG